MKLAVRFLLGLLLLLGLARAVGYLDYAAACLPSPLENFHLEAKMVLLAYRAEHGESLYPSWRGYPHVANFFGPVYFGLVGLVGSIFGSDIRGLFLFGRGVTFVSGLATSLLLGLVVARRYGRWAGASGAILSLGAAPMFGFSVMVRPDLTAELLGLGGYFLSGYRSWMGRAVGGGLLVLAALTKQTAAVFLLAAVLAWALEGKWRRGLRLALGCSAALAAMVAAITLWAEPNFAASLVGEAEAPWEAATRARNLGRICLRAPDLLLLPTLGLVLWATGAAGGRGTRPAVLTAVLLASSIGLSGKRGADLNYYLSLRASEALAVGALWRAGTSATGHRRTMAMASATLLGCLATVPGAWRAATQARLERQSAAYYAGPEGREFLDFHRRIVAIARDPGARLLTDSGMFDLYQGTRAAFGDPFLFRMMAETGRIDPALMRKRIDSQYYDLIVTTSDLNSPAYDSYEFGLPGSLAERARARYIPVAGRDGVFLYRRRPNSSPLPPRTAMDEGSIPGRPPRFQKSG